MIFDIIPLAVPIVNTINTPFARNILLMLSLLVIPAAILVYLGLRSVKK